MENQLALSISQVVGESKVEEVMESLQSTQSNFAPNLSIEELWNQEKPYYEKYGMSAFDAGYLGLTSKN